MDFTYIVALVFAFICGLIAQAIRLVSRNSWTRMSGAVALGCALLVNGALLLNWSHLLDWGFGFAILDLSIIAVSTIIGFGAIAPGALAALIRK